MGGRYMPPKARITKEMIVDAAFLLVRKKGFEKITAQSVAEELGCSTQPIMSHFKKVEDLRMTVAEKADQYHSAYLMKISGEDPLLEVGLNYIRFAREEGNLFRLLFQSGGFSGTCLWDSLTSPELQPLLEMVSREAKISPEDAGKAFKALFLVVHGYASMFAANEMEYDESEIKADLTLIFEGTICSLQRGKEDV